MTEEGRERCLTHKSGARDGERKRVGKGGKRGEKGEMVEKGEEEDWVRERADTGFAWSVRLVGKTTGRGRLQRLIPLPMCACLWVLCGHGRVSSWARVYERVRTRGPGYETLTGI